MNNKVNAAVSMVAVIALSMIAGQQAAVETVVETVVANVQTSEKEQAVANAA